jgi:hypothetical protein
VDRIEATRILEEAVQARQQAREAVRQGKMTADGMTLVIKGILRLFPDLESGDEFEWGHSEEEAVEHPRGAEAVRAVMKSSPMVWYTIPEMVDALAERDWLPQSDSPANAVRGALTRAATQAAWGVQKGRQKGPDGLVVFRYNPEKDLEEPF